MTSKLRNFLDRTSSRIAIGLAAMGLKRETKLATTRRVIKGRPFGHYIDYEAVPNPDGTVNCHRFLHATKGWRTFRRVPHALLTAAGRAR
jgi:hypothetical protein